MNNFFPGGNHFGFTSDGKSILLRRPPDLKSSSLGQVPVRHTSSSSLAVVPLIVSSATPFCPSVELTNTPEELVVVAISGGSEDKLEFRSAKSFVPPSLRFCRFDFECKGMDLTGTSRGLACSFALMTIVSLPFTRGSFVFIIASHVSFEVHSAESDVDTVEFSVIDSDADSSEYISMFDCEFEPSVEEFWFEMLNRL